MKILLSLLFLVRVMFPLSPLVYRNVTAFFARDGYYVLTIGNNKTVYVPIMFTIIEEL